MSYGNILKSLRKRSGYTQEQVAGYLSQRLCKSCSLKAVSHWESGEHSPSVEQFLLMCEMYGVRDIPGTFQDAGTEFRSISRLNDLGRSRAEEYIAMLCGNSLFSESDTETRRLASCGRTMPLFDLPVAAGLGTYLDSDSCEEFEADDTVPEEADFALKVSGDSMTPRFIDGQIIFVKQQPAVETGEFGIFELNGASYVKKMGRGELISLNKRYEPIPIREFDSFRVFGKVVG